MFARGILAPIIAAFAVLGCVEVRALIFPLPPGSDGSYDFSFNVLQSYDALWASNHHALYNIGSQNGVGIAPRWLLTAWHVAQNMDEQWWVNDDHDRYYFREKVDLGNDLALIRVDKPLPFYSRMQKFAGGAGDILTVYGQSGSPEQPILDSTGRPVGWKFAPITNHSALRWGQGRRLNTHPSVVQWTFTANDLALGNGGLNCAAVNTNDSGGGIFLQDAVVGIIKGLIAQGFRYSPDEPVRSDCETDPPGHVYDGSTLYRCLSRSHPFTRADGASVYFALSNIFAHISPPQRINAGGPALEAAEGHWDPAVQCDQCESFVDPGGDPINPAGLTAPAPQSVYKSAAYLHGNPGGALTFTVGELIRYEKYKVRLHFASIFPADKPGAALERITVNDFTKSFDPYTGPRAATILEFADVSPDQDNQIRITLQPQNPEGNAAISGIEVLMNPLAPAAPPELKWDPVAVVPGRPAMNDIIFGNGVFISGGMLSTDTGGTWQPLWLPASGFTFVNGLFFTLGGPSMLSSADGKSWNPSLPFGVDYIAYGNGRFVATFGNQVAVSVDAKHWELSTTANPVIAHGPLLFVNGRFVASTGAFKFISSFDGTNWVQLNVALPDPSPGCTVDCPKWRWMDGYVVVNDVLVAYGLAFNTQPRFPEFIQINPSLLFSSDAERWKLAPEAPLTPYWQFSLGSVNQRLIYFPSHSVSTDLTNWHSFPVPKYPAETAITNAWQIPVAAAYGNSNYVLVGINQNNYPFPPAGPSMPVMRGPDFDSLVRVDHPPTKGSRTRFTVSGKTLIVVNPSPGFPLPLHVSTNSGASFVPVELPPDSRGLLCVQQLNNQWVAAGERGVIIHSADAIHWERSVTSVTNDLFEVSYGAGKWVAVGTDGIVLTSVDLNAFSVANSGTTSALNSVCFGSFGFVAVGADGATAHSADGRDWSAQKTQEADLLSVTYGGGTYLAVGEDGHTQASQDGNNWSISHPTSARLRDVAYADGFFFAAESSTPSIGYFSQDGTTWAQSTLPWNVGAVAAADESFWFVDGAATINRVRLPDPEIRTSAELTGPDSVRVEFDAPVARDYTVLSSSDLVNWNSEATLTRGSSDLMS